jgi:hypothetical protein
MTNDRAREFYLRWLEHQLTSESSQPTRGYFDLAEVMFTTEFTWSVPMDDNRLADAMELRIEFAEGHGISRGSMDELGPCSFLEVLIGLSRRMSFVAGGTAPRWAWQLVINLGLERMWDRMTRSKMQQTLRILETVIQRTYEPNGVGGFFPLAWPDRDQTRVELWYQLNSYVEEMHPEH